VQKLISRQVFTEIDALRGFTKTVKRSSLYSYSWTGSLMLQQRGNTKNCIFCISITLRMIDMQFIWVISSGGVRREPYP